MEINYFSRLQKYGLTPNQHYLLFCFKNNLKSSLIPSEVSEKMLNVLKVLGYLDENNKLTNKAEEMLINLSGLFRKTAVKSPSDLMGPDFLDRMNEFRSYFPTVKRASPAEIKTKFAKLFIENPTLDWDKLIQATALYFSEDREEKYIYKASNFIMVQRGGINTYPILEYYERIENGESPDDAGERINVYKIY